MNSRFVVAALLFALGAACAGGGDSPAPPTAPAPATVAMPAATAPVTSPSPMPGGLSEEQFKALHHPPEGTTVMPKGQAVTIAGATCYLSLPAAAGEGPVPGVVVIHEWWGLNDHIKLWADRLADEGYAALAVDLYGGVVATDSDAAMAAMQAVDDAKALEILLAAHAFLRDDERVKAPRRGSLGWCFGGRQSLNLAIAAPDLDAAVIYYGHLSTDPEQLASIRAELLGVFGTQDEGIPPAAVAEFEAGLTKAGVRHAIHSYDAPHAFANPSNPRYDEANAAAAWEVTRGFLARALKQAP